LENSNGGNDFWIVKTDSLGIIEWQNTIGGSDNDMLWAIQQSIDGGYIFGGGSESSISGDKAEISIGTDYWVVLTDSSGNILWQNTIGGNGINGDALQSIQQTSDGSFILGGKSDSNISGEKTENCIGGYDYWILKLTGNYNFISGKMFIDQNSNSVKDIGEQAVIYNIVTESGSGRFAFTEQNGIYYVTILDTGSFYVFPDAINYYNAVPVNHSAYFSGMQQTDSLNDFAFQPAGVFNDLCASISLASPLRAGFNATYTVNYENIGTTTLSPTVVFYPDTSVTFISSIPAAGNITPDSVVWNFGPLAPYQSGSILITVNVNVGTPIGTQIYGDVTVYPIANDEDTVCNRDSWKQFTIGSFDPNEILVSRDSLLSTDVASAPILDYIIYFQNTGNDTAFNVKVLNPIDTSKLQLNTFNFVASSHPVNITWKPWERNFEFAFDNILLPDSNIDEPRSHGFIRYRIKPKTTLTTLDTIKNTAYIYFDFNAPVQTNTAITRVVLPTAIDAIKLHSEGIHIYPNPTHDKLYVESNLRNAQLEITDVAGRTAYSKVLNEKSELINVHLSPGLYFAKVTDGVKIFTQKLVIE
jgi:hypothetical protein